MDERQFMKRALFLAEKGKNAVRPNPMVGAVLVKDGSIIGEGYHKRYGGHHAEIEAFLNAEQTGKDAVLYVTLEPCCHQGKTPPCVLEIIRRQVKRVVIGMADPNPLVGGKGISLLRQAGIQVDFFPEDLRKKAEKLNEVFIKYITTKTPFVTLKWAMSLDGKIATATGESKWITNEASRAYVQKLRQFHQGIMVGITTVKKDNPFLTVRKKGIENPVRIVMDAHLSIPIDSHILENLSKDRCIIVTKTGSDRKKEEKLKEMGAEILFVQEKNGFLSLEETMKKLGEMGIDSVLIEGGGTLLFSGVKENIADKAMIFISPRLIGGKEAKTPLEGEGFLYLKDTVLLERKKVRSFGEDICVEGYFRKGAAPCSQD